MKSCHKHRASRQAANRQSARTAPQAVQRIPVHRYSHPIPAAPDQESTTDQLLSGILESLSRQSLLLEELLRRTGGDGVDTK